MLKKCYRFSATDHCFHFIFFSKGFKNLSFELEQSFKHLVFFFKEFFCFFRLVMIFWIIQHRRTHTILSFLAHEYFIIHATFATGPECFILCQLGISNRFITKFTVDFHYGKTGSKTKYFCIRIFFSRQVKYLFLDAFATPLFLYSGATIKPLLATYSPFPCFDITKANPCHRLL